MMIHEPTARTVKCTPMGATFPPTWNRRQDFGRVEVQITIDDPQNDTRPFTIKFNLRVFKLTHECRYLVAARQLGFFVHVGVGLSLGAVQRAWFLAPTLPRQGRRLLAESGTIATLLPGPGFYRSVITFASPPGAVAEGALRGIAAAVERIDLRAHSGVLPRIGAADVVRLCRWRA